MTEMEKRPSAEELLRTARVIVAEATFALVSLSHSRFAEILQNSDLSPRGSAPFFVFSDKFEVTLMLDDLDFANMRAALTTAKTEIGFRLLTFDVELDFAVSGFLAIVTQVLSDAKVPVIAASAFSRDHVLIKQDCLAEALKALGPHVAELC